MDLAVCLPAALPPRICRFASCTPLRFACASSLIFFLSPHSWCLPCCSSPLLAKQTRACILQKTLKKSAHVESKGLINTPVWSDLFWGWGLGLLSLKWNILLIFPSKYGGLGSLSCMGTVFWASLACSHVGHDKAGGTEQLLYDFQAASEL